MRQQYAPSPHYQATAMAAVAAVEEATGTGKAVAPVRESDLRELQAQTDELIGEEVSTRPIDASRWAVFAHSIA